MVSLTVLVSVTKIDTFLPKDLNKLIFKFQLLQSFIHVSFMRCNKKTRKYLIFCESFILQKYPWNKSKLSCKTRLLTIYHILSVQTLNLAKLSLSHSAVRKTVFSFSRSSEEMVFPKKIALEYDLSCIIRKNDISFPENMILFFGRKMKDTRGKKEK